MHLSPHVEFALRRAHKVAVRNLDDARRDLDRDEKRLREARERVARHEAEEAELREALEAGVRAEAEASAVEAAEARLLDRVRLGASLTVPLGSPPSLAELRQLDRDDIPGLRPADTRRARESWEH